MKKIKLAIVGATGLVGRTVLKVLEEYNLPISEYVFFASSRSSGTTIKFKGKDFIVRELKDDSFKEGFDYAIFSAGGDTSKHFSPIATSNGCIVIDNSSAFRMDDDVPLIVPEVNPEEIKNNHGIIANPNCSTIQAVIPLKLLDNLYKLKRVVYSTYQAVSGAGQMGVEDLENGLKGEKQKKFPYSIVNNCLPHIDVFTDSGYTKEELKMINETRKILKRPDLKVTATCVRVPVINSHSESINVEFEKDFNLRELIDELKNFDGIVVQDDPKNNVYPLATNASGHDEVFVGRIRRDESVPFGINFWCVSDNIRKGAASNAVQILEKLISEN
ncbi:MAG: aspartate-semialdehyde dehydrogenase [Clostridia bacterium]|nr:aspartate-semialdehyde dehydrogenase [Clostridia bacterium]